MRPLQIANSAAIILGLQDEIRRSEESRYDHRLHGVLLVAQGMTCPEVAYLLGDASRSVEYWVGALCKRGSGRVMGGRKIGTTVPPKRKTDGSLGVEFCAVPRGRRAERNPLGW